MNKMPDWFIAISLLPVAFCGTLVESVQADIVLEWNRAATDTLLNNTDQQNPGMASRTMAMVNLAIYDAFAMTTPQGSSFYNYGTSIAPDFSASTKAAAAQAACTVLSMIYPDQASSLQSRLSLSMAAIGDSASKTSGIALGNAIGQSIYARRANDGYDSNTQYIPSNEVGHWQPDPVNPGQQAWGPDWGDVQTFALQSNSQFLPPPPPALTSQEYADAFNEVKDLGALNSSTRTAEQTEIGLFWAYDRVGMGTPIRMYNQALTTIAMQQGNTEAQNAELFAKASVAAADAGIVAWNAKFEHDLWRPVTGIREADLDGNPGTEADPDWVPLGAPGGDGSSFTPPFPTYISGHATFGAAIFETIAEFYGTNDIPFSLVSDEVPGVTRSFLSLSEAMQENGRSRVYLGIHWNYDDTMGQWTGQQVAHYISASSFTAAVPEPSGAMPILLLSVWGLQRRRRNASSL